MQDTEVGSHRIIEEDKDDEDVYSIGVGEVHWVVKTEAEGPAADILVELLWDWEMFVVRESKFQKWNTDD